MLYYFYKFDDKPFQKSQVETWDGTVIKTTPALAWAIGKQISWVISFSERHGYHWKHAKEAERMPSLSSDHPKQITDTALFERVSP